MAYFSLKVLNKDGNTICVSSGEDFVDLVCAHTYEEGDRIVLETSEKNIHVNWQVDDAPDCGMRKSLPHSLFPHKYNVSLL